MAPLPRIGLFFLLGLAGGILLTYLLLQPPVPPFAAAAAGEADDVKTARFADYIVFVQMRLKPTDPFTEKSGCTCSGPKGHAMAEATVKSTLTCGYPGAVSEVSWKYVKTTDAGDTYLFSRRFPIDAEITVEETKEVTYTGKEVIAFQDKSQRIGMAPRPGK